MQYTVSQKTVQIVFFGRTSLNFHQFW